MLRLKSSTCISNLQPHRQRSATRRATLNSLRNDSLDKNAVSSRKAARPRSSSSSSLHQTSSSSPSSSSSSTKTMALPSLFGAFGGNNNSKASQTKRESLKQELLAAIAPLDRGASATEEQKRDVAAKFAALERLNPNPSTLSSPLLNGRWKLLYTTSSSILGTTRPAALRPRGPIYQLLDGPNLRARNRETWPFFNAVAAELEPESRSQVAVQFKKFYIFGLLPVTAPATARGKLDVTYLDETLRLSRGDKGNIFVLEMDDRNDRP